MHKVNARTFSQCPAGQPHTKEQYDPLSAARTPSSSSSCSLSTHIVQMFRPTNFIYGFRSIVSAAILTIHIVRTLRTIFNEIFIYILYVHRPPLYNHKMVDRYFLIVVHKIKRVFVMHSALRFRCMMCVRVRVWQIKKCEIKIRTQNERLESRVWQRRWPIRHIELFICVRHLSQFSTEDLFEVEIALHCRNTLDGSSVSFLLLTHVVRYGIVCPIFVYVIVFLVFFVFVWQASCVANTNTQTQSFYTNSQRSARTQNRKQQPCYHWYTWHRCRRRRRRRRMPCVWSKPIQIFRWVWRNLWNANENCWTEMQ